MSEVTKADITELKDDIKDLYEKNNDTNKVIASMAVNVAEIATTMKTMPAPPKQPCEWHNKLQQSFESHIEKHEIMTKDQQRNEKEKLNMWKKPIISTVVKVIEILITGGIIYSISKVI